MSRAILQWLHATNIETALIDPGKPWQNGANESFNGKLRDECLSMQWFKNRIDAKILIEDWRQEFNAVDRTRASAIGRPRSSRDRFRSNALRRLFSRIGWSEEARQVS